MTATLVRSMLSCKKEKAEEPVPKSCCRRSLIREEKAKGRRSAKPHCSALCKGCRVPFSLLVQWDPASPARTGKKKEKRGTKKARHERLWLCIDPACPRRKSLTQQGLILPPKGTWTPPSTKQAPWQVLQHRQTQIPSAQRDLSPGEGRLGQIYRC